MVVLDAEDDLGRAIVPTLYVKEAAGTVLATGAEVDQLHLVELVVREEDVLRLHVTVDYAFVLHKF